MRRPGVGALAQALESLETVCNGGLFHVKRFGAGRSDQAQFQTQRRQPLISVIGAQPQAEFCPAGEHSVGLCRTTGHQIINHHPDVAFVPPDPKAFRSTPRLQRGVGTRHKALRRRFFVARGAVDLPGEEQPWHPLGL